MITVMIYYFLIYKFFILVNFGSIHTIHTHSSLYGIRRHKLRTLQSKEY